MPDAFVILTAAIDEGSGEPTHWVEAGSRATEADAMRFAQTLRKNDVCVRIFAATDPELARLLAEAAAAADAPTDLYGIAIVDKLGLHTVLHEIGWMADRKKAQELADLYGGAVIKATASGPRPR